MEGGEVVPVWPARRTRDVVGDRGVMEMWE